MNVFIENREKRYYFQEEWRMWLKVNVSLKRKLMIEPEFKNIGTSRNKDYDYYVTKSWHATFPIPFENIVSVCRVAMLLQFLGLM